MTKREPAPPQTLSVQHYFGLCTTNSYRLLVITDHIHVDVLPWQMPQGNLLRPWLQWEGLLGSHPSYRDAALCCLVIWGRVELV